MVEGINCRLEDIVHDEDDAEGEFLDDDFKDGSEKVDIAKMYYYGMRPKL